MDIRPYAPHEIHKSRTYPMVRTEKDVVVIINHLLVVVQYVCSSWSLEGVK